MNPMARANRLAKAAVVGIGGVTAVLYVRQRLHSTDGQAVAAELRDETNLSPASDSMSLKSVQVFFRHGARTPLKHIPGLEEVVYDKNIVLASVPYTEFPIDVQHIRGGPRPKAFLDANYETVHFKGGVTAGQLTAVGKEQMYQLGRRLGNRYGQLVGKQFDPKVISLRSTNINRCITSLQCVLAGMFGNQSFKDPVVIPVDDLREEILFPSKFHCPSFQNLLLDQTDQIQRDPEYIKLVNTLEHHTGVKWEISDADLMQVRDHIVARKTHSLYVPDFLERLYPEIVKTAVDVLMRTVCGCSDQHLELGLSFSSGRVLNLIANNMKSSTVQTPGEKSGKPNLYLYSCHDSSVAPLLLAVGCFDNEWPPYSADVAFELYEDKSKRPWVKVRYCGKELILHGCETSLITLDKFIEVIHPFVLTSEQYKDHCHDSDKAITHIKSVAKHMLKRRTKEIAIPPNI